MSEIRPGDMYGMLTVLDKAAPVSSGSAFICKCSCGSIKTISRCSLVTGHAKSCGCIQKKTASDLGIANKTHGLSKTRLYKVWDGMHQRCYNPKNSRYKNYGAKGVKICKEWKEDYLAFYEWAMSHGYDSNAPRGCCTIDRINPFGNYEPQNCRWVSMKIQNANKRRSL